LGGRASLELSGGDETIKSGRWRGATDIRNNSREIECDRSAEASASKVAIIESELRQPLNESGPGHLAQQPTVRFGEIWDVGIGNFKIDNLKLRTKILIPLALMAAGVLAVAALGATRLMRVSATASVIIERRDVAAMELARASHLMAAAPHAVFAILLYDKDDPQRETSKKEYQSLVPASVALLDHAATLLPDRAADIGKFKKRFQTLAEDAKDAFKVSIGAPGLLHGLEIQQTDLVQEELGARLATAADMRIADLTTDMEAFNETLLAANAKASQDLNRLANNATVSMAVAGIAATLLAGAFAMWMTTYKVARPLSRMVGRMKALAQGDLNLEIEGLGRRDEIGEMAAAVEVFKTNAVQRERMESEAAEQRAAGDAERGRVEAEKAQAAEAQSQAMSRLGESLKRLADGDLTTRLDPRFPSEFAKIRADFNAAAEKLMETVRVVVSSTSAVRSGAREITSASDDLSRRTEQQAASLGETVAALEEISSTLNHSAAGAKHASEVVASADDDAKKGAIVVKQAVSAMDAISQSSEQIGRILSVMDEIAFQTNLLALNAGVEAARAGDAGKGFAVVASEVRALAQRSAEAAKDIKQLISTSSKQVESGAKLVAESGKAFERIINQVSEINRVVADIATGAQEQATGIQQINTAINGMDRSTQQNATIAEESTAASHSLSQEMTRLAGLIEQFRVGDGVAVAPREPRGVAPEPSATPARAPSARAG
jgi:methyl-accepting chemotaxis protein